MKLGIFFVRKFFYVLKLQRIVKADVYSTRFFAYTASQNHESTLLHTSVLHKKID